MDLLRAEPELLDHLVVEFADHGRRAVEFLATAEQLLRQDAGDHAPRFPEAISYCLREAMKEIPASQSIGGAGLWRSASRKVTDARRRYERARGIPGEDEHGALNELLGAIDDLEIVHSQEGIHERRLIAIIVNRTGAHPVAAGTEPIRAYHDLLGELDDALHNETTLDQARALWNRCIRILRQLFLPPDIRHVELDVLASVDKPEPEHVTQLLSLVAGPHHLSRFLSRVASPAWLDVLTETGILDPPAESRTWPAFSAVSHLAEAHAEAVAAWLDCMYDRHGGDPARSSFIARAAVNVGEEGAPVVIRALRDHAAVPAITAMGVLVVENLSPDSELVEHVADVVLNEAGWRTAGYVDPVIERLIGGSNEANVARRLQLLCWKLRAVDIDEGSRRWFGYERSGSVADWDDTRHDDRFAVLLRACVDAISNSTPLMASDRILEVVDTLSDDLRGRMRARVLAVASDVDVRQLIEELARAIAERDPTGDDLPLLDRVVAEVDRDEYAALWTRQLGPAPSVVEVAGAVASNNLPKEWWRAFRWAGVLPQHVIGLWSQPISVIAAAYGRSTRDTLEKRQRVEMGFGQSPMTADELAGMPPIEAARRISAWRPDPSEWLVGARELARTLEDVVKENGDAWLESPVAIVTELKHPTYVHHYLSALAKIVKDVETPVEDVLDIVVLVRAHPWDAQPLGRDDSDYDADWRGAELAAVEVLKAMADADIGFADRDDEVWAILESEVRNRAEPSGIVSGARDPLESALNRPCTRALDAVLSFMACEFRTIGSVRREALVLLKDSLRVPGTDGAEHRAILATRLGFLRHVASDWMDDVADLLLGSEAPDGLAQATADLAIKWSRPNRWLLENHRPLVRDAVTRDVEHAVDHLLIAMLWNVPGYGVQENIAFLRQSPALLSKAGEVLGRLLRHGDTEKSHIDSAVAFWDAAIAADEREGLAGFGWMAEVDKLDDKTWAELTMKTVAVSGGRVDWAHKVAERIATLPPSTTGLAIMNHLVRGSTDEWDRRGNIERAAEVLDAAGSLADTPEYQRLRTTLLERGGL